MDIGTISLVLMLGLFVLLAIGLAMNVLFGFMPRRIKVDSKRESILPPQMTNPTFLPLKSSTFFAMTASPAPGAPSATIFS